MITESQFSDEDYYLIEANQLGTPLKIYRLRPSFILSLRWIGLIAFLTGIATLVFTLSVALNKGADFSSVLFLCPSLMGSLYAVIHGGVFHRITVQQARSMRVIVCEAGLQTFLCRMFRSKRWLIR
jgi:hypothetical protein